MSTYNETTKPKTAEDLIRRYNLDGLTKLRKTVSTLNDGLTKTNTITEQFVKNVAKYVSTQDDGYITCWFYDGVPTLLTSPFIDISYDDKINHVDDLYYDRSSGNVYILAYVDTGSTVSEEDEEDEETTVDETYDGETEYPYEWVLIDSASLKESMALANSQVDTYDNMRKVYFSEPTTPYYAGDVWYTGSSIKRCTCSRSEGDYNSADWCLQSAYSDNYVLLYTSAVLDTLETIVTNECVTTSQLATTVQSILSTVTQVITTTTEEYENGLSEKASQTTVDELLQQVQEIITANSETIKIVEELTTNGVTQVTTETGYTFNKDGLTIDESNSGTKNTLDSSGMTIVDKSGSEEEELFFAGFDEDTGQSTVRTNHLKVSTYLEIGTNSRIEDYTTEDGTAGTGIFYIG